MKAGIPFLIAASAACSLARGEVVQLDGNDRATGRISAMTTDGMVTLHSPMAHDPLQLRDSAVRKIFFGGSREDIAQDARLELTNGDTLLCNVQGLNATHLNARSEVLGDLHLPRTSLRSLNFGMTPLRTIFRSEDTNTDWLIERGWLLQDKNMLAANGNGCISRKLDLPEQFLFRCRIEWRDSPNLRIYLADGPEDRPSTIPERYYFQIHQGGIDFKRQSKQGRTFTPLYSMNRHPANFNDRRCDLELRIDRKQSMIYLYLNGQYEARFPDTVTPAPAGQWLRFESVGGEAGVRVSNIEVREWNSSSERYRTDERGDGSNDAMVDAQGQRWLGNMETMAKQGDALRLTFKPLKEAAPLTPNSKQIATVFFAGTTPAISNDALWKLQMRDGSTLHASACQLNETRIILQHPSLGALSLPRNAVLSAERLTAPKP